MRGRRKLLPFERGHGVDHCLALGRVWRNDVEQVPPISACIWEIALLRRTKRSGTVMATRKTRLLALDAQDFHALIARVPALAAHVQKTAEARLADTAEAEKGDLAADEIAQAVHDDQPPRDQ